MSKVVPYQIVHLHLEDLIYSNIIPELDAGAFYFVCWWKQIPLGHFYFTIEEKLIPNDFKKKIIEAVSPTINFYLSNDPNKSEYAQTLIDLTPEFAAKLKLRFSVYELENIPESVNVTVVICTRNRSENLNRCLKSLARQLCKSQEIIVIDNAPTDNSTELVVKQFPEVKYFKEPRPGLDIARNLGAIKATCPIVAYTDDDVQVHKLWAYNVWESFKNENIQAITGLVISSSLETESQQIFEKHWGFNKGYRDIFFGDTFFKKNAPKVWEIGAGANMAFRKTILEKVDFFDERLDVGAAGCSGDSEIWFRMLSANAVIQYSPRVIVFHEHRKNIAELQKQIYNYMRGHAASVLIQHAQNNKMGYRKYLFSRVPKNYLRSLIAGFPNYNFQYQTVFSELKGLMSGVRFYKKNKYKHSFKY